MFLNPNTFSNLNSNCSNLLDIRNLQEQVQKAFCYQKLLQIVLVIEKSFCKIFETTRKIHSNSKKGQNNFWQQNAFLTCSWRFLICNKLEQLEFKLEKITVIQKHAGKVRKRIVLVQAFLCIPQLKTFRQM